MSDSFMGIFMPEDLSQRIMRFMASRLQFPYVGRDEVLAAFYLFGREGANLNEQDIRTSTDIAKKAVEQVTKDIRLYENTPARMDSDFTRENYTRRSLQIVVESRNRSGPAELNRRIANDPVILSDCFAQHIAYYKKNFYFELFQPLQKEQFGKCEDKDLLLLQRKLVGRMLLLGFNVADQSSLPTFNSLEPFLQWMVKMG